MNSLAFVATSVAAVGLALAAHRISRVVSRPLGLAAFAPGAVAIAIAISTFLTVNGLVARALKSFDAGLVAAALAAVALAVVFRRWPTAPPAGPAGGGPKIDKRIRFGFWAALVAMTALYAILSFRYQMHDEYSLFGHKAILEELRRGVYPAYMPPFPGEEGHYHYGFDVLSGALARAYGLSADLAIDLTTIGLVIFMCWSAAAVAVDAGAARSAPFAAVAIHLGAGLAALMLGGVEGRHPRCLIQYHHPTCDLELYPTQILNVFQHPVAVGVPLFLVFVILAPRLLGGLSEGQQDSRRGPRISAAILLVVLPALSFSQLVYYALGGLAAVAALPVWLRWSSGERKEKRARAIRFAGVLAATLLLGWLLGGMFASNSRLEGNLILFRRAPGYPENKPLLGMLEQYAGNLGLGFLCFPIFAAAALRERRPAVVHLTAFAFGGMLAPQLFVYTRSWDIVKFPSAASFALSMLYVLVIDRWLSNRAGPWRWIRRFGRGALIVTGFTAAAYLLVPLDPAVRPYDLGSYQVESLLKKCIDWWREHGYRSDELIYAQSNIAAELAMSGGLSVVAQDADLYYHGVKNEVFDRQQSLANEVRSTMSIVALKELGVKWLLFSDEELPNLGPAAVEALEKNGAFEVVATFEDPAQPQRRRRIWRVRFSEND